MRTWVNMTFRSLLLPRNLILLVGMLFAGVRAYWGLRASDVYDVLRALLFIVGALGIAQIVAGYGEVRTQEQIRTMLSLLQQRSLTSPPLELRTDLASLPRRAPDARDILVVGRSLATVVRYTEFLKQRLQNGAAIRLVLVDTGNAALCEALGPLLETSVEGFRADVESSMALIGRIAEGAPSPDRVQVRTIQFVPTLSYMVVDGQLPSGHVVAELLPYQVSPSSRPHLLFRPTEHPSWYAFFRDNAELIWREATCPQGAQ